MTRQALPTDHAATAKRQCPTLDGDSLSLITHRIEVDLCCHRQREHYHKCHRCVYRGKPVDFVAEERLELMPVAETGVPRSHVDLVRLSTR